jgi:FkbM family methyltransferase
MRHAGFRVTRKLVYYAAWALRRMLSLLNIFRVNQLCTPVFVTADFTQMLFWKQSWKTDLIKRLVTDHEGAFIDVGANVGQTLFDAVVSHPMVQYIGFEPNPLCVLYLRELLNSNKLKNCRIIPAGLSDKSSCVPLYTGKNLAPSDDTATIIRDLRPREALLCQFVPCFRFDEISEDIGVNNISFVKIDVEGAELEVIVGMKGSVKKFRPIILCEVLFTDESADIQAQRVRNSRLYSLLIELNYCVFQLIKSVSDANIIDAKRIEEFESAYYTYENAAACDYLFVPKEKERHVQDVLFSSSSGTAT